MGDCWTSRNSEHTIPFIYSFITLRRERFGALLFNPYLGKEEELDPTEAYIADLCNGNNSCRQVEMAVRSRFGMSPPECQKRISEAVKKLSRACALDFREGEEATRPRLPDTTVFSEDAPYLSAPKSVIWDVTYACNLNCAHCLTSSGKAWKNELTTQQALFLIAMLSDAKIVYLSISGGEPFLRPDILTLLRHIATTNMRVDIATNGMVMPEKVLRGMRDLPVFQVQVSIDGIGKQHDRFRRRSGAFDAACHTVRLLRQEGIAVSLSTTVTAENVDVLDQIIDLALELGCSGFKAIPFLPAGRGQDNADSLKLDLKGHRNFTKTIVERSQELKGKLNIATETCFSFLLEPPPTAIYSKGPMGCSAGYDTLNIGADGTAFPCPFLRNFALGNMMNHSLKDLWRKSPILKTLRSLQKQDMDEPCKSCLYSPVLCGGGCRAAAYLEHGDLRAADPTCFKTFKRLDHARLPLKENVNTNVTSN